MDNLDKTQILTKVLNFGSLNVDYVYSVDHMVKEGETLSCQEMNIFCGGKGLNQSIALTKSVCTPFSCNASRRIPPSSPINPA